LTVRDVAVQLGFLMVTAGAMLLAWAVLTGQIVRFRRHSDDEDVDSEPVPRRRSGDSKKKPAPRRRKS
jgi:hypothetical protein